VHIVTTKSAFVDKAQEMAMDMALVSGGDVAPDKIMEMTKSIISLGGLWVCESVEVVGDEIFVSIDVDVIDDDTIWEVLNRIYNTITTKISPTKKLSYTLDELSTQFQVV
jgi:hypothetical protein